MDVAKAIAPSIEPEWVGIRPGEKIHEEMITEADSFTTYDMGPYYAILPQVPNFNLNDFVLHFKANKVEQGFRYSSGNNTAWLTAEDIRQLIRQHIDPEFQPL
jgi:FlaA1/EpsC-like NDP-sugar epimerase